MTSILIRSGLVLLLALTALEGNARPEADPRGCQFFGWTNFAAWERTSSDQARQTVLLSPLIESDIHWNELVASWNAHTPPGTGLRVEVCAIYPGRQTRFYNLGRWSLDPAHAQRASEPHQRDPAGRVQTDTLILDQPAQQARLRITLFHRDGNPPPSLRFVGVSVLDPRASPPALEPDRAAWGIKLPVPARSQANYPGGEKTWCSPTAVSMVLGYWASQLHRPELDRDVPEVASGVFDPQWPGTGNWPFNTAYAGSFPGIRAYVVRLTDVSELEDWVVRRVPVVVSVCYDRLRGRPRSRDSGHLVVCIGFTSIGDPIFNDPGTRNGGGCTYPRENLVRAWRNSRNTAYLIHPVSIVPPPDRFGHWFTDADRQASKRPSVQVPNAWTVFDATAWAAAPPLDRVEVSPGARVQPHAVDLTIISSH